MPDQINHEEIQSVSPGAIRAARCYLTEYFGTDALPVEASAFVTEVIARFTAQKTALESLYPQSAPPARPPVRHALDLLRGALSLVDDLPAFIRYININPENLGIAKADLRKFGIIV